LVGRSQRATVKQLGELLEDVDRISRFNFQYWLKNKTGPAANIAVTVPAFDATWQPDNLLNINDLAAMLMRLHGRVVGGSGSGKSVLTKALVRLVEGNVQIYDVEATNKDWKGFQIVGRGENWQAIADAMKTDLKMFKQRVGEATSENNDAGWDIFKGQTVIRVVEEYPDAKDEINSLEKPLTEKSYYRGLADEWCQKLARRGRKPGVLLLLISQYDGVTSWGFEGKGNLVNCFHAIRLGEFAVTHAKKVGDDQLVKWVEADLTSRCMVDNRPCQLPDRATQIMIGNGVAVDKIANSTPTSDLPAGKEDKQQFNEYETAIIEAGKKLQGDVLKARTLKQQSRLFADMSPEDIRLLFQSLADRGVGEVVGTGNTLGWQYNQPVGTTSTLK
jgi:ABC-type oligopeptide transport system ATPase subunit